MFLAYSYQLVAYYELTFYFLLWAGLILVSILVCIDLYLIINYFFADFNIRTGASLTSCEVGNAPLIS